MIPGDRDREWDEYWRLTREAAAYRGGGPQEAVLARFWSRFFDDVLSRSGSLRLVDLGCGNGAVARFALEAAVRVGGPSPSIVCVDTSVPGLQDLLRRLPSISAIAADARRAPLRDGCFDVVTSQFGLEYAGVDAFSEAARLVTVGGLFAAVIHLKDGGLYRECTVNLEAVTVVNQCGLLPATREVFRASHALTRGQAGREALRYADRSLANAVRHVDEVLRSKGEAVAGGTIHRLYSDIAYMYGRMAAYAPQDVEGWVEAMSREMAAYERRMSSMLAAAVDHEGMETIARGIAARGLSVRILAEMEMGVKTLEPAAWLLVCDRR